MTRSVDVLVVGAGPTGLALALQARSCGATVRVVERREEAWRPSRALLVHARTLEVLRPLGVVDALLEHAQVAPRLLTHVGARTIDLPTGTTGSTTTPYAHLTLVRQADVEATLAAALAELGVEVERGVAVAGFEQHPSDGVRVRMQSPSGPLVARCLYLVGCDGAASAVRAATGLSWRGFAYPTEVVLADVELDGAEPADALHVYVNRAGLVFLFPHGEHATWRLLATRPLSRSTVDAVPGQLGPPVPAREIEDLVAAAGIGARCDRVAWSSRVRMAHRLADSYRSGRVLLAGDAAHVHSPATGQGMNTGIQDATNLGWKLAYASGGVTQAALLDSYELERRPVARQVSAWTDLAFWVESGRDPVASLVRGVLAPLATPLAPLAIRPRWVAAQVIRMLGQLRVAYRDSPLSAQHTRRGPVRAGDRLPDAVVTLAGEPARLHELTARPGVHVLLHEDGPRLAGPDRPDIHVHRVGQWAGAAMTVVRPDGYVGLCSDVAEGGELAQWLSLVSMASPTRSHAT
jgi:2-polyprenyl-6-methoxyphenol hydroxylase-like FAD-dependent oxidoreductase